MKGTQQVLDTLQRQKTMGIHSWHLAVIFWMWPSVFLLRVFRGVSLCTAKLNLRTMVSDAVGFLFMTMVGQQTLACAVTL